MTDERSISYENGESSAEAEYSRILDETLSPEERSLVMTTDEYRQWRLGLCTARLQQESVDVDELSAQEIIERGMQSFVNEFWGRDEELIWSGSLDGLGQDCADAFRPVVVVGPDTAGAFQVDRTKGRITPPRVMHDRIDTTRDVISSRSSIVSGLDVIRRHAVAMGANSELDLEGVADQLVWDLDKIREVRDAGNNVHMVDAHHMVPAHRGNSGVEGDDVQVSIPVLTHFFMHLDYTQTSYALAVRLGEQLEQDQDNVYLRDLTRWSRDEYIQNAASVQILQGVADIRQEWSNQAVVERLKIRMQEGMDAIDEQLSEKTLLNSIASGNRNLQEEPLSSDELNLLNTLAGELRGVNIIDLVRTLDQRDSVQVAAWVALHNPDRLLPKGSVARRKSEKESDISPAELERLKATLAEIDDTPEMEAEDHMAGWILDQYMRALYGQENLREAHWSQIPVELQAQRDQLLESLSDRYDGDELVQARRWARYGMYDVCQLRGQESDDFAQTARSAIAYESEDTGEPVMDLSDVDWELAETMYHQGMELAFNREQLIYLEGEYGGEYEVPGIQEAADIFTKTLDSGKKIAISSDGADVDGISAWLVVSTAVQALTGRMPEATPGTKKEGHSIRVRDLVDLALDEDKGLIVITDRGSGVADAKAYERFFNGVSSPADLLRYAAEYRDVLTQEEYDLVVGFVDSLANTHGWSFAYDSRLEADFAELREEVKASVKDELTFDRLKGNLCWENACYLERNLDAYNGYPKLKAKVESFLDAAKREYQWELESAEDRLNNRVFHWSIAHREVFPGVEKVTVQMLEERLLSGELDESARREVHSFLKEVRGDYGWQFTEGGITTEDLSIKLREYLNGEEGLPDQFKGWLKTRLRMYERGNLSEWLDPVQMLDDIEAYAAQNGADFVKAGYTGQDVVILDRLATMKSEIGWRLTTELTFRERAERFAEQNVGLQGLTTYVNGCDREDLNFLVLDHHEISPEARAVFERRQDRFTVVNPKARDADGVRNFNYDYSGGVLAWQLANAVGQRHQEFRLDTEGKKEIFSQILGNVKTALEVEHPEIVDVTEVSDLYSFNSAIQKKLGVNYVQAATLIERAVDQLVESEALTGAQGRFFKSYSQSRRYAYDFVKHSAYWAALSTSTDVMPMDLVEGGSVFSRALYRWALEIVDKEARQTVNIGDKEIELSLMPGYERLQIAAAKAMKRLRSTLYWPQSHAADFWIGPMINALLREGDREVVRELVEFLMHRSTTSGVRRTRDLIAKHGAERFEIAEKLETAAKDSEKKEAAYLNKGIFRVADITSLEDLAGTRTGIAANHLVSDSGYARPALVFCNSDYGVGRVRASIRVPGGDRNSAEIIKDLIAEGLIIQGGGHAHASGFVAKKRDLERIVEEFNRRYEGFTPTVNEYVVVKLSAENEDLEGQDLSGWVALKDQAQDPDALEQYKQRTLRDIFNHGNVFEIGRQFAGHWAEAMVPTGLNAPEIAYEMNIRILDISGVKKTVDGESEYVVAVLEDENGNQMQIRAFDDDIKVLTKASDAVGGHNICNVLGVWENIRSPKEPGIQKVRRDGLDGDEEIVTYRQRMGEIRPRFRIISINGITAAEV